MQRRLFANDRLPDMAELKRLARELFGSDLTEEEASQALALSEFHLHLIREIESRWIKPSTREFVSGLRGYLPNLTVNQQIHLFNTYCAVKHRRKV